MEKKDRDGKIKESFKNFQNFDQDEVYDMLPEHLTLVNEEMLGQISQVQDEKGSPMKYLPKVIEQFSESKKGDIDRSEISGDQFLSPEHKDHNDDSAINH